MSFSTRAFYEFAAKQTLLNFISASLQAGRQRRVVFSTLSRVRLAQARRLMGLQSARLAHSGSFDEFYYRLAIGLEKNASNSRSMLLINITLI